MSTHAHTSLKKKINIEVQRDLKQWLETLNLLLLWLTGENNEVQILAEEKTAWLIDSSGAQRMIVYGND